MRGWEKHQTAEEMEVSRKYEYDPTFLPFLYKWLNLKPGMIVVDVGCRKWLLTRILACGLKGEGRVVGIDPSKTLVLGAEKIAQKKGFSNIEFKVGSIYKIPTPNDYADLTICHIVLCNIPPQFDAILDMKRVTKIGGEVVVIDPAKGGGIYYPDKRLNELNEKFRKAFVTALYKERSQKRHDMIKLMYSFTITIGHITYHPLSL